MATVRQYGWWLLPLVLGASGWGETSLWAYDEGYYAVQARWLVTSGDWLTLHWWGELVYDRAIGLQWLIGLAYQVLGPRDWVARLPGAIATLIAVWLTYEIGCRVTTSRTARWGAMALCIMPLWVQYSHLATQDIPLVTAELLGIWGLLRADDAVGPRGVQGWTGLAGVAFGLGFALKGLMICLPPIALLPYLWQRPGGLWGLVRGWGLWLGLGLGLLPTVIWLGLSSGRYGWLPVQQFFGKVVALGEAAWHPSGPFYYVWNVTANGFPVALLAIAGGWWLVRQGWGRTASLLVGYPFLLGLLLSLFRTRTPYYGLQLYPFLALLAAIAIEQGLQTTPRQPLPLWPWRWLSGALGTLGGALLLLGLISLGWVNLGGGALAARFQVPAQIDESIQMYAPVAIALGAGWSGLWLWQMRPQARLWRLSFWAGPTLALVWVLNSGLWGNYSPDLKQALAAWPAELATTSVDFVVPDPVNGTDFATWVLLSFYTPHLGDRHQHLEAVPPDHAAWVSRASRVEDQPCRLEVRDWCLLAPEFDSPQIMTGS